VTEISAGPQHSCYLLDDASVRCSGENGAGQLGDGSLGTKSAMSSPALTDAMGISAGGGHTCAVRKDGSVWCWGTNNFGQLGVGYFGAPVNTALRVQNISDAVQVSAGTGHACALRVTGQVLCWGLNSEGQLTGDSTFSTVPIVALEGATSLDVAASTSCAVMQDGSVRCWGRNANGQVGDGTTGIVRRAPTAVLGVNTATAVAVGLNHTCALLTDGTAGCWGKNASGELGRPGAPAGDYPQSLPVANLTDAITLQAGGEHNCVVQPSGLVLCWGRNLERQLATANDSPSALPIPTAGGFDVYP
jgi:alpha-tubulin suppressor-like RCC1 family protein